MTLQAKEKSIFQKRIDELLNTASVLERIDGASPETVLMAAESSRIIFWPDDEITARKIVGQLIIRLRARPEIIKYNNTQLSAVFNYGDVQITIYGYRGRKCALVKKQIIHEAEPEKIIPAQSAWVEEVEELVCEMPSVEQEIDSEAAKAKPQEEPVPF